MPRSKAPPSDTAPPKPARRTAPRPMTERRLENIAMFYLQRFSATAAHLRRVLMRRVDRSIDPKAETQKFSRAEMAGWVDRLVARLVASGAVNDVSYAEGQARKLRMLGKSPQRIRTRLSAKGVAPTVIADVIAQTSHTDDGSDAALVAALAYARRRRLGPFRDTPPDREEQRKDLGVLARAGFSLDIARQVMAASAEDV